MYDATCQYAIRLLNKLDYLNAISNAVDIETVRESIKWAKKYHEGQMRKSGEPFYSHPVEVAYMVSDYLLKTDTIVASVLHDIVEDTTVTSGMITDRFGWRASEIVNRLTRDRPDGTILSVKEILGNAHANKDNETIIIKILDRLHNMETIGAKSPEKQRKTALETINDIMPYVHILPCLTIERWLNIKSAEIAFPDQVADLNKLYSKEFSYGKYHLPFLTE